MVINFKIRQEGFIKAYLKLFNGILGMTSKEIDVVEAILLKYEELKDIPEPHKSKLIFSAEGLKEIRETVGVTESGLNNYKAQLKKKGIIVGDGRDMKIDPKLQPQEEITFKFKLS
jgi:hypothetical protein